MTLTATYDDVNATVRISNAAELVITNPGVEVNTTGWFGFGGTLAHSTEQAHSGTGSAKFTPDGSTATPTTGQTASVAMPVTVGWDYRLTIWVYSTTGRGVRADISWRNVSDTIFATTQGDLIEPEIGVWTKLTVRGTAPATAVTSGPRVSIPSTPEATDIIYVDDMALEEINPVRSKCALQRSVNGNIWTTVRGGAEINPVDNEFSIDDEEFISHMVNTYRLLPEHIGLGLTGDAADYAKTADHASLDITGDIDIRAEIETDQFGVAGATRYIVSKYVSDGNRSYALRVSTAGNLQFAYSTNGTSVVSRTATAVPANGRIAVRVTFDVDVDSTDNTVTFYTAPSIHGPWTQLGDEVTNTGTITMFSGNAPVMIGTTEDGTGLTPAMSSVYALEIRDGIDGTEVANPDFEAEANGVTSFADAAGRTWTIEGSAHISNVQTDTVEPEIDGIWFKPIMHRFLKMQPDVRATRTTQYASRSANYYPAGRSLALNVHQPHTAAVFDGGIKTTSKAAAEHVQVMLASGVIFVQAPPAAGFPTGYYSIGGVQVDQEIDGYDNRLLWTFTMTQVAAPGPDVVGTQLIWPTIERLFGSWDAFVATYPTWVDVDLVSSPGDLAWP